MTFTLDIALPIFGLILLAAGLPFLWAMVLPEGIPGLIANFALSALVISVAVSAYFITWYAGRDVPLVADLLERPGAFLPFLAAWAVKTAIIWAPVLVLALAAQPRRWKEVVW